MSMRIDLLGARPPVSEPHDPESIPMTDRSLWGSLPADTKAEILADMARKAVKPIPDTDDQAGSDN